MIGISPQDVESHDRFIVDPEGRVRSRKVALVGLGYEDASHLGDGLAEARPPVPA